MPDFTPLIIAGPLVSSATASASPCSSLALRNLGTARTGAYFSTAPFLGAIIAVIDAYTNRLRLNSSSRGILMVMGVWLHLTEMHEHEHEHATWSIHTAISTTRTISTSTARETRPSGPMPIGIAMCVCATSMRMCPTCTIRIGIEATGMKPRLERVVVAGSEIQTA